MTSTPTDLSTAGLERCRQCNSPMRLETFKGPHIEGEARVWICSENTLFGGKCRSNVALFDRPARTALGTVGGEES
jgi:hypothetical protein